MAIKLNSEFQSNKGTEKGWNSFYHLQASCWRWQIIKRCYIYDCTSCATETVLSILLTLRTNFKRRLHMQTACRVYNISDGDVCKNYSYCSCIRMRCQCHINAVLLFKSWTAVMSISVLSSTLDLLDLSEPGDRRNRKDAKSPLSLGNSHKNNKKNMDETELIQVEVEQNGPSMRTPEKVSHDAGRNWTWKCWTWKLKLQNVLKTEKFNAGSLPVSIIYVY